jgi:hypothetical protein
VRIIQNAALCGVICREMRDRLLQMEAKTKTIVAVEKVTALNSR